MSSGLQIPGSLGVTLENISAVLPILDRNIQYQVETTDRASVNGSVGFVNFIEASVNINSYITYDPSGGDTRDDAYALSPIAVTSASANNIRYDLPSVGNVSIDAGLIDATDPSGNSLGTFPVTLTVNCDNQGVMTSTIAISGQDTQATASEDPYLAQKAYWPNIQALPSVDPDDGDELTTKVTAAQLTTYYSKELEDINAQYNNKNLITSWDINIFAIESSTSNVLSKHVRFIGRAGDNNVFQEGEKLVAGTPFTYGVTISDYLGIDQTIVAPTSVVGVLVHSES